MARHQDPLPVRIFKMLWRLIKGYLIVLGLLVTLAPLLIYQYADRLMDWKPSKVEDLTAFAEESFVLELEVSGEMLMVGDDPLKTMGLRALFSDESHLSHSEIKTALAAAAKDDKVKGLFVEIRDLNFGLVETLELHRLLQDFRRQSGKPVRAHSYFLDNQTLILSSAADSRTLEPTGMVVATGPVFSMAYLGDTLRKFGLDFEVFKMGKYKSAMENLTRSQPSPEALEEFESLESSLRSTMIQIISESRQMDYQQVEAWLKRSLYTNQEAAGEAQIVDQISHYQDAIDSFKDGHGTTASGTLRNYWSMKSKKDPPQPKGDEGIGLLVARGDIIMSSDDSRLDAITPKRMSEEIKWLREKEEVKAVVLRIESPGGSATASEMIWRQLRRLAEVKPIIVSMGSVAASGGYYIAAASQKILADHSTITGSIGVIGAMLKMPGVRQKYGLNIHVTSQSDRKRLFDPMASSTYNDRKMLEDSLGEVYETFKTRVSHARNIDMDQVERIAQGRVYTAALAIEAGLVDEIGGVYDAFKQAKAAVGLDPEALYPVYRYEGEDDFWRYCLQSGRNFFRCFSQSQSRVTSSQTGPIQNALEHGLLRLQHLSKEPILTFDSHAWQVHHGILN